MKTKLISLALAASLLCGCGTIAPDNMQRVQTAAKIATYVGATEYLRSHPETRPAFVTAKTTLTQLSQSETLDWVTLLAVVNQLPVKQLQNERAKVIVTVATITISDYAGALPLDRLKELQPLAGAMAEGLTLALGE